MNLHAPQSIEAATELRNIAAVPLQIVSPRESAPIVSVVQDTLVGANRFTRDGVLFTKKEAMALLVHAKRWDGKLPEPVKTDPQPMWSGRQLLSALLPPVSLDMKNMSGQEVEIYQGMLQKGTLDKAVFGKQLLHIVYNDYGPDMTVDFLDSLQAMIANFLMNSGFSVGISDLIADKATNDEINVALSKLTKTIEDQILQLHTGLFENSSGRSNQEEFEAKVMGTLNKAVGEAGKIGLASLADTNRMTNMIKAGSKGSDINVSQMVATLGQQAIEGKRVPNGFQHRTLPHYKRFDDSAPARGFIASSYIKGLQPDEFFFHAMSGREGLIDTAVKTADTGYMQRQIRVALEDLITQHDGSVRDAMGNIVQIMYGEDGANATKLEGQRLPIGKLGDEQIQNEYAAEGASGAAEYIAAAKADRALVIEKVFGGKMGDMVRYPVHLERMLRTIKYSFNLNDEGTVTAQEVLDAQATLLNRTHAKNKLWGALVRWHMRPAQLKKLGYTKVALDAFVQQAVLRHWQGWVEPGQPVGVIAAQSIGEPATQMSAHYNTKVVINGENVSYSGPIGAYIDELLEKHKEKVLAIGTDSVVLDLDGDAAIVGVSTDEKTSWLPISQVSRHPANGGLVEVFTRTGRSTTATLSHSFLKRTPTGIAPILGSELKVGDRVPVAKCIAEVPNPIRSITQGNTTFVCDREFGWICGLYVADGCFQGAADATNKRNPMVETKLKIFAEKFGFDSSKDNHSVDLHDFLETHFGHASFEKKIGDFIFHAPTEFIAGFVGGYFDGEGNVNTTHQHICVSSRNESLVRDTGRLLGYLGLYGHIGKETSVGALDAVQHTLTIAKPLIKTFQERVGFQLPEKAEALQTIATYMMRAEKASLQDMLDKIPACGELIAETGKLLQLPDVPCTFGNWVNKESIGRETLQSYLPIFTEALSEVKDISIAKKVARNIETLTSAAYSDVLWDEIVELKYHEDPHTYVYDFTVPGNDSFMVDDNILVHNTLNSVDWHTDIIIMKDGEIQTPRIGEWIDEYISKTDESKIQRLPNDQLYVALDDTHDWKAISCDEKGNMMWTKLEAITKHPVVNEDGSNTILEVTTESGRVVRATKGKSFLVRTGDHLVPTDGVDLKVGDELPIANSLAISDKMIKSTLDIKRILSPKEWVYGHNSGANECKTECDYPTSTCTLHIPSEIPLTREFGFFCGAFLSEGSTSSTQIQITTNDTTFLAPIHTLLDEWSVEYHTVSADKVIEKSGIKGHSQSLVVHSTLLTTLFRAMFGRIRYEKTIPAWFMQAPDIFLHGLVDGYISGNGCVQKNSIKFTSSSESLISGMTRIFARYGIFCTWSNRMPAKRNVASVHRHYSANIVARYAKVFANTFTLSLEQKQDRLNSFKTRRNNLTQKYTEFAGTNMDRVKAIREIEPYGGRVYDITVQETRNFVGGNLLAYRDTFHLAGVAAKSNMTRGVPRLKELLKATKKPKATEVVIPLRTDLRGKKEEARRVAREIEFTLLEDIVTVARIYYDPRDTKTLIAEDADWLAYMAAYEEAQTASASSAEQPADALAAGVTSDAEDEDASASGPVKSPWILRFELDRERMFAKDITMDDIAYILSSKFSADIETLYTDYNSTRLVFRARLLNTVSAIDDLNALRSLQNKILTGTAVRGIPGLRAVNYTKTTENYEYNGTGYAPVDQYVLVSDGSNFLEILCHPDVDATRVVSSDIHDMMNHLGIEATRATLYKEIDTLFKESGSSVNYRHVGILLDKMCHKGKVMSVDRYGINKNDIGPLAKMSFEQTEDIALRAAMFGERDPVLGVSAHVMLGAPIRAGTAFSEVLFDEAAAIKMGVPDQIVSIKRGLGALTEEDIEDVLLGDEDETGQCAPQNLRMSVPMPAAPDVAITEELEEDLEIALLD
jgi:DNA-directed RNA polymerase beta' subunit